MKANYHTHCTYCDGKDPLSAFVQSAEERHFDQLGFSSHAPVPFENGFAIQESDLTPYCEEIEQLKGQTHLRLFKALECDFIPGMSQPFDHFKTQWNLDYIIGGEHHQHHERHLHPRLDKLLYFMFLQEFLPFEHIIIPA